MDEWEREELSAMWKFHGIADAAKIEHDSMWQDKIEQDSMWQEVQNRKPNKKKTHNKMKPSEKAAWLFLKTTVGPKRGGKKV